ncbi:MAG: SH3 domain-containing protein [Anaerolineales bacterium]|nr:SH3 domain-containing protein [Anaerolineales bacterium]
MKRKIILVSLLVLMLLVSGGCNVPLPICSTDSLQAVTPNSPAMWSTVDSLSPTLQWTYPSSSCTPQGYAITLRTGPFFTDDRGGGTGNPSTSWSPGSPLEPGKEYAWSVAPINDTTLGPSAGRFYFFTGPTCATDSLVAPVLLEPAEGASFNEANDSLIWDYPADCAPEGYRVDLSVDPTFADTSLSGGTGNPSTRWGPGSPLVDCQIYYWRIAPINGTTLGPFSTSRSFVRDETGLCGGPGGSPPPSASISGIVWHDLCAVPDGPAPEPLPAGCVSATDGSLHANGIREAGEPGIAGVQVDLHWGGCATASVASVLTDTDGHYQFDGILAFGSYCLAIRSLNPPNDSILLPGGWTFPPGLTGADAFANAMVDSGTILTDKDFGWDYQFLPVASAAATAVPLSEPKFVLDKNAFCRKGPGENYPDLTAIPQGDTVDILGVSENAAWYYIFWKKFNASCWVASSTGHLIGDLQTVPIFTPVPTLVPTAVKPTPVPSPTPKGKQ